MAWCCGVLQMAPGMREYHEELVDWHVPCAGDGQEWAPDQPC
jgi:hypothetical protein